MHLLIQSQWWSYFSIHIPHLWQCLIPEFLPTQILHSEQYIKFLFDFLTKFKSTLSGYPGFDKNNMPIGMQIIGNSFEEARIYKLASFIEKKLNLDLTPGGEK